MNKLKPLRQRGTLKQRAKRAFKRAQRRIKRFESLAGK